MRWWLSIAVIVLLLLAWQISQADSISTTISCAGATFLASSVAGPEQSYSNSLFTDNPAHVTRNLVTGKGLDSTVKISGNGSFGVDEYQEQIRNPGKGNLFCMMNSAHEYPGTYDEITASGLFQSGEYLSARSVRNKSSASRTEINGTGMIVLNSRTGDGNGSSESRTYAAGPMRITEDVRFGRDE